MRVLDRTRAMRVATWAGAALAVVIGADVAGAQGAKPAASGTPKPAPAKARYTFTPQACQGRKVLVFDDARSNLLAMDGMLAWITMTTEQLKAGRGEGQDEGPALVEGLKKAGCAVEHWREPSISIDTSGGKKWVLLGEGKKEEYKPVHALKGGETQDYDVVVGLRQGQEEHTKHSRDEALKITFASEADVQARGRDKVKVDGSWVYTEATGLPEYASYTDKQAAEKRVRSEGAGKKSAAEDDFRKKLEDAVRAALGQP